MPSTRSNKKTHRRQMFLKLAGQIESQLRDAYAAMHEKTGLTQTALATKLGVNRSAITHRLMGAKNMTTETVADMVWALDHDIRVKIFDPKIHTTTNYFVADDLDLKETDQDGHKAVTFESGAS